MGWGHLSADLLQKITTEITDIEDYVRFRSVSSQWRTETPKTTENLPHRHLPWLLFHSYFDPHPFAPFFFNLSNQRRRNPPLPFAPIDRIFASSNGWLLQGDTTLWMFNPITFSSIRLPRLLDSLHPLWGIRTARLFGSNLAVVLFKDTTMISLCRFVDGQPGEWIYVDLKFHLESRDLAYHDGMLFLFNPGTGSTNAFDVNARVRVWEIGSPLGEQRQPKASYLVVMPNGRLVLMLFRDLKGAEIEFSMFVLVDNDEGWIQIQEIGNNVLFVDRDQAVAYDAGDFNRCRADCIYFVAFYLEEDEPAQVFMFIDLEGRDVVNFLVGSRTSFERSQRAVWFVPSLRSFGG